MGAQNSGCHLVYWKLMSTLRLHLESHHNVNVVYEINRWCRDGPMSHADDNLSPERFPKDRLKHLTIRRLIGDYIGIPILFLQSKLATKSLNASVERLEKRLGDAGLYTNSELCIFCHSLGGTNDEERCSERTRYYLHIQCTNVVASPPPPSQAQSRTATSNNTLTVTSPKSSPSVQ